MNTIGKCHQDHCRIHFCCKLSRKKAASCPTASKKEEIDYQLPEMGPERKKVKKGTVTPSTVVRAARAERVFSTTQLEK